MPVGRFPEPPGSGVQARPPEPLSPRIQVCLENTSLDEGDDPPLYG